MNILVLTASGRIITRPDTSWERKNEDLYVPEEVDALLYTPVLFARISRPGKSIASRFADRYYDAVNYGMLLYPAAIYADAPEGVAEASCFDHTSYLPAPLYNKITLGQPDNRYELSLDGKKIFDYNAGTAGDICDAFEKVSHRTLVRAGDFLAIELAAPALLCERACRKCSVSATWCENQIMDFKIIY